MLIDVRNLVVSKGGFVLRVPRWTVEPGTVVGLVGPNGAGKSTLLELLPGFSAPSSGTVRVFGCDPVADPVAVRSRLGFMSDDLPVFMMPTELLLESVSRFYPRWNAELAGRLMNRFGVPRDRTPGELSKGENSKLRLVLAMAFEPQVLVLDEPGSGLDLGARHRLLETVLEVAGSGDRAVIISSHLLADVERIADRLLVLNDGAVIAEGATAELVGDERTLEEALVSWGAAG